MFVALISAFTLCSFVGASQSLSAQGDTLSLTAKRFKESAVHQSTGNQTSHINLTSEWWIPVSIGTPPQSFLFLGDSGAPGFAVASVLLPMQEQPPGAKYDPSKSLTAKQRAGYTYELAYVSGDQSHGLVYQDVATIGDLTIQDMDIEVQTGNNHNQTGKTPETRTGQLGLSFDHTGQSSKPTQVPTWLMRVMPTLKAALFTVDLNAETREGSFDFGFIDSSRYSGDIAYAALNNQSAGGWTIPISGQQLSNGTLVHDGWSATMDTGTAGASIPRHAADQYFGQIDGAKFDQARETYTYPCSSKRPDFTFLLGSQKAIVPGDKLNGGPVNNGNGTCSSLLGISDGDVPLWGRLIIEQFLVVFDWDGARVGFANRSPGSSSGTTSGSTSSSIPAASSTATSSVTAKSSGMVIKADIGVLVAGLVSVLLLVIH